MPTEAEITTLADQVRNELTQAEPVLSWQRRLRLEGALIALEAVLGEESDMLAGDPLIGASQTDA